MRNTAQKLSSGLKLAGLGAVAFLVLLAWPVASSAQTKKKPAAQSLPRNAQIVSEANTPETPKPATKLVQPVTTTGNSGGYRGSLQDLVTLRESELAEATTQHDKMVELARDGLVSKKAVDESADAIVEARAKLADARVRLAAFDGTPMTTEPDPEPEIDNADNTADTAADHASAPAATETKSTLKKTSIVHPRRRTSSRAKTH